MSERFIIQVDPLEIEDDAIFDNKELRLYECQSDMMSDICSLLNQQDQRIAELEEQLKNAIVPKFKIGDKVYANTVDYWENDKPIRHTTQEKVEEIVYFYKLDGFWLKDWKKEEIFATKEEAQAKLKELGENDVKD